MPVYTVHVDQAEPDPQAAVERMVLVPEQFSVGAYVFGPIWLLWSRLWLALAIWLMLAAILIVSAFAAGLPGSAIFWIYPVAALVLGLEGNSLRRRKLERNGFACVDIASGSNREEAERRFLGRLELGNGPTAGLPGITKPPSTRTAGPPEQLGGLFRSGGMS